MNQFDYSIYYSRFSSEDEESIRNSISSAASAISAYLPQDKESRILDVGCGWGFALLAAKHLGYKNVQGIEVSAHQAERAIRAGLNVSIVNDSTKWLDGHRDAFDHILLLDVLEHIPVADQIPMLRSIFKALKPGGSLHVKVPNANAMLAMRWRYNDFTHHSSFTEHSLYFVLKNACFESIEIDNTKVPPLQLKPSREGLVGLRRWFIRWCWLQVVKCELGSQQAKDISFELNLVALARKSSAR